MSRQPTSLADAAATDPMFNVRDGKPVTREQTCECGRPFTQRQLSERFLAIVEKRGRNAMASFAKQIPDFYVPVHCPPCERVDLRRRAELDAHTNDYPPPFGERHDAA